jgi:hypothetical protein
MKTACLALATMLLVGAGCSSEVTQSGGSTPTGSTPPEYLTPDQVFQDLEAYLGQRLTVRGWAHFSPMVTMMGCIPPRCDCNHANAYLTIQPDPDAIDGSPWDSLIGIADLQCGGNECSVRCTPFDPLAAPAFEFVGELQDGHPGGSASVSLKDIDLDASRQLAGGTDLHTMTASPLTLGSFACGCELADDYCHINSAELSCEPAP